MLEITSLVLLFLLVNVVYPLRRIGFTRWRAAGLALATFVVMGVIEQRSMTDEERVVAEPARVTERVAEAARREEEEEEKLQGSEVIQTERMSFERCGEVIRRMAEQLAVAPINLVETSVLRMVRFPTNDGSGESILITCSKPDRKLVISKSW